MTSFKNSASKHELQMNNNKAENQYVCSICSGMSAGAVKHELAIHDQ